jgi:hypothetical protein
VVAYEPEAADQHGHRNDPGRPRSPRRLPRSRATETFRSQLVATGCLPKRNNYAADFQSWLNSYLIDDVAATDHRLHLHEYGTWRLLPRIHQCEGSSGANRTVARPPGSMKGVKSAQRPAMFRAGSPIGVRLPMFHIGRRTPAPEKGVCRRASPAGRRVRSARTTPLRVS